LGSRNFLSELDKFLEAWDGDGELDCRNDVGDRGNVNIGGAPDGYEASILAKSDPRFFEYIEPGVRGLVRHLVEALNCITYSSCEGHRSTSLSAFRRRHVGIVPRHDAEAEGLRRVLTDAARSSARPTVEAAIVDDMLESESRSMLCIDVVFVDKDDDEECYFRELDGVCDDFLAHLIQRKSSTIRAKAAFATNVEPTE
jgi:hypothetical protein